MSAEDNNPIFVLEAMESMEEDREKIDDINMIDNLDATLVDN